mgnify:FL=1
MSILNSTMEFFDRTLATIRIFGLSSTGATFIAAMQYKAPELLLLSALLDTVLFFMDLHYQRYMWVASRYALLLEEKFAFIWPGLTRVLEVEHRKLTTRYLFPLGYIILIILAIYFYGRMSDLWSIIQRVLFRFDP